MNNIEREFLRQRRRREAEEENQGEILPIGYSVIQIEEERRKRNLEESFQNIIVLGNINNDEIMTMSVGRYVYFRIKYFLYSREDVFRINEDLILKFKVNYRQANNQEPREIFFYNIDYSNYISDLKETKVDYFMFCGINEVDKLKIKNYFREKYGIDNEENYYMTRQEFSRVEKAKFFSSVELGYFYLTKNILFQEWMLNYWDDFYEEETTLQRLRDFRRIRQYSDLSKIYNMTKYIRWLLFYKWFYTNDIIRIAPDRETIDVKYEFIYDEEIYEDLDNHWGFANLERRLVEELEIEEFNRRREEERALHAGLDIEEILRMLEENEEAQGGNGEVIIYQGYGWQSDVDLSFESTSLSDN